MTAEQRAHVQGKVTVAREQRDFDLYASAARFYIFYEYGKAVPVEQVKHMLGGHGPPTRLDTLRKGG